MGPRAIQGVRGSPGDNSEGANTVCEFLVHRRSAQPVPNPDDLRRVPPDCGTKPARRPREPCRVRHYWDVRFHDWRRAPLRVASARLQL
jgi:hypothetical protein